LDIDSPGGEAVGAFEAAALVRSVGAKKPVTAVVNGMACSAAYALASAATTIIATPSAIVGNIGVVMLHRDLSGAFEKAGVKPTLIFAGARKVDGNPYQPLPPGVRADLQNEVDQYYRMFVDCVAAGRGTKLTAAAAKATEARTYIGIDAISAGLADQIGGLDSAIVTDARRASQNSRRSSSEKIDINNIYGARRGEGATAPAVPTIYRPQSIYDDRKKRLAERSTSQAPAIDADAIYASRRGTRGTDQ
jgi:signal peptide peptidase SppA